MKRRAAMKKVLITGITGFVGSHLADYCLARGHAVYGLRRYHLSNLRNVTHIEHQVQWCDCDMLDMKAVIVAINKIRPDIIFHMASQSFVSPSWDHPNVYMDANYKMTVNLMEACRLADINPRIHIPGSGEEYGEIYKEELPITPTTPMRPVNPYAVTKIAQDLIAYVYFRSYGMNMIRTRAFNHEGPRRDKVFGIPWYAYQIARVETGLQKPLLKVGYIDDRRNFTHVKDMVHAYWLAVEKGEPGELYLIGVEKESHIFTFRQALEMLIDMSSTEKITYEIDDQYVRLTQVPRLICDTEKFSALTDWEPQISFEQILSDTLDYWREQLKMNPER